MHILCHSLQRLALHTQGQNFRCECSKRAESRYQPARNSTVRQTTVFIQKSLCEAGLAISEDSRVSIEVSGLGCGGLRLADMLVFDSACLYLLS